MRKEPFRLLDLFSGIGGFSLGLERSEAFKTVAFCEIEPFCRRVLAKHWPQVPQYDDIRTLTAERLAADGIGVDAICGGFPCTNISHVAGSWGEVTGLDGEQSGLWWELFRLVRELRPKILLLENVPNLLGNGMAEVVGALSSIGYDCEWQCLSARILGAPHIRNRVWIVSYPGSQRRQTGIFELLHVGETEITAPISWDVAGTTLLGWGPWARQPPVPGVDERLPNRLDEIRSFGNCVLPQIPEIIGRAIAQAEGMIQ